DILSAQVGYGDIIFVVIASSLRLQLGNTSETCLEIRSLNPLNNLNFFSLQISSGREIVIGCIFYVSSPLSPHLHHLLRLIACALFSMSVRLMALGEGLSSNDSFSRNFLVSIDLSDEENRKAV
uniref:Uncharacterized protein n=1 Tax=Parascaris univalens TaxID=6257 RepID=A0A915CLN3_PARUN